MLVIGLKITIKSRSLLNKVHQISNSSFFNLSLYYIFIYKILKFINEMIFYYKKINESKAFTDQVYLNWLRYIDTHFSASTRSKSLFRNSGQKNLC